MVEATPIAGDGVTLSARRWPGEAPPIVAIHGMSANAMFYVGIAERLAGRRAVLSLDLRGRGGADKPDDGYGIAQHADDVAAAMADAGIGRAVVVGHSMGAAVAWAVATRHPQRCSGVVVFDGGPHAFADFFEDPDLAREFLVSSAPIEERLGLEFADVDAYREHWRGLGVYTDEQWGPWAEAYVDADSETVESSQGSVRKARCRRDALQADAIDMLGTVAELAESRIQVPVLAIRATSGIVSSATALVSDVALERMESATPRLTSMTIPDTNHYTVALADPAATMVADALATFADEVENGA